MANYAYITPPERLKAEAAEELIREAVRACLDPHWTVERRADFGPAVWLVFLPGTEEHGRDAVEAVLAPGDPVGFMVDLQDDGDLAFRHGPNMFEGWAQGCVEEQIADALNVGVLHDGTDIITPPGTRWYRSGRTFREHIRANLADVNAGELDAEDEAFIERQMYCVPEGHR